MVTRTCSLGFMGKRYFTPKLVHFLEDLADNNDRDWFKANQETYEAVIRDLAGDNNHYAATVIDESFRGKNRVQQQRMVNAALAEILDGPNAPLHALALTTHAPD